ncbi:MAG: hypothetical protein AAF458_02375 [Pseudomonadota bacterium]
MLSNSEKAYIEAMLRHQALRELANAERLLRRETRRKSWGRFWAGGTKMLRAWFRRPR